MAKACAKRTSSTRAIWAAVLILRQARGGDRHGPRQQPGEPGWPPTIITSRDNDEDRQPGRKGADEAERDVDRDEQRLVGERVEHGAELAAHVEALGDEAVEPSERPAARKSQKARSQSPAMTRAMMTGTRQSRASVIRLGSVMAGDRCRIVPCDPKPRLAPAAKRSVARIRRCSVPGSAKEWPESSAN